MMDVSEKINNFIINSDDSVISKLYSELNEGQVTLLHVVEGLGEYLTSSDVSQRCSSTKLLTSVIPHLTENAVKSSEVPIVVIFFLARLKDHHSVQPVVLHGVANLICNNALHVPTNYIHQMYREINAQVHVQSLTQSERRHLYHMTNYLLSHRLQDLQEMGGDFVFIFIQTMDGEKDPRNLVLCFGIVAALAQHFPLGVFAEDLFEVVACYFPIEFTPPPNDPHGITKQQLVGGLRTCLSATQRFAEFCLPMLLEKISSSIQTSKIDGFRTLATCCETYGPYALKEYLGSLASAVQREVIASLSDTLEKSALDAMTAMTRTLSTEAQAHAEKSLLNEFIKENIQDIQRHLMEGEEKLLPPVTKLLCSLATGSHEACCHVIQLSIPIVTSQFHNYPQVNTRRGFLEMLLGLIKTTKSTANTNDNPLVKYKEEILPILHMMLSDSNASLRSLAVSGLVGMVSMVGMVTDGERLQIVTEFVNAVLHDGDESVRSEAVIALTYMSTSCPTLVTQHVLPRLSAALRHEPMEVTESGDAPGASHHVTSENVLSILAALSTNIDVINNTVPLLLQHLKQLNCDKSQSVASSEAIATCHSLLNITKNNLKDIDSYAYLYSKLLPACLRMCIEGSSTVNSDLSSGDFTIPVLCLEDVVLLIAKVVRCIACHANQSQSKELLDQAFSVFIDSQSSCLNCDVSVSIEATAPWPQSQLIILFSAIVSSLPTTIAIPRFDEITPLLFELMSTSDRECTRTAAAQCYASYLNKSHNVPNSDGTCYLHNAHTDTTHSMEQRKRALSAMMWVVKAAVLSSQPQQTQYVNYLLECLQDIEWSDIIADGFYVILNEYEDIMTSAMHCDVKLMYRQRLFHMVLPRLVSQFKTVSPDVKPQHLRALTYLMRFVPKQVLRTELPPIIPMLVQSLELSDQPALCLSTLNTAYDLLHDSPDAFVTHISDVILRFTALIQCKPNMKIRIAALQCLGMMTTFDSHKVLPYKPEVLRQLKRVLDDGKRLVRLEATKAASEWHLLGEPGS